MPTRDSSGGTPSARRTSRPCTGLSLARVRPRRSKGKGQKAKVRYEGSGLCHLPFDLPRFNEHRHPKPRPQRDERPGLDAVSRYELQAIALRQRRHAEMRFDEGELIANALPWSGAERQVDELRPLGDALGREALGFE